MRDLVYKELKDIGLISKADRYNECAKKWNGFTCEGEANHSKRIPYTCDLRICECRAKRTRFRLTKKYSQVLNTGNIWRFTTITGYDINPFRWTYVKDFVDKCCKSLRDYGIPDYLLVVEIKQTENSTFYTHCHIIHRGKYVVKELLEDKLRDNGVDRFTDTRMIRSKQALMYLAKYISKPQVKENDNFQNGKVLARIEYELHQRKTYRIRGVFYGAKLDKEPMICKECGNDMFWVTWGYYEDENSTRVHYTECLIEKEVIT